MALTLQVFLEGDAVFFLPQHNHNPIPSQSTIQAENKMALTSHVWLSSFIANPSKILFLASSWLLSNSPLPSPPSHSEAYTGLTGTKLCAP